MANDLSVSDSLLQGFDNFLSSASTSLGNALGASAGKSIAGTGVSPAMPPPSTGNPTPSSWSQIFNGTSGGMSPLFIIAGILLGGVIIYKLMRVKRHRA